MEDPVMNNFAADDHQQSCWKYFINVFIFCMVSTHTLTQVPHIRATARD